MLTRFLIFAYLSLVLISCGTVDTKKKMIGVQEIGKVDQKLINSIQKTIEEVYDFKQVIVLPRKPLPQSAFTNVKSPRYRADSILKILKREKPDSIDFVIGILSKDISTTKRDGSGNVLKPESKYLDWGVFGLGYRPGPSCVLSTYRIQSLNNNKFEERMKKVCMHEIGHNLGLSHCKEDEKCVMRDAAETIKTVDFVDLKLCDLCKRELNFRE